MGAPLSDRQKYPGLHPAEVPILRAWLAQHEKDFERIDFNVRVGGGDDLGPTYSDEARRQWKLNTQKRIDAVGFNGTAPTIIEVKDRAGSTALGELLLYAHLFAQQFAGLAAPKLVLVTNLLQPDMATALQASGIRVDLVVPK